MSWLSVNTRDLCTPASYLAGSGFKTRPGDLLS
jgi:hypothetical protein